MQLDIKYLEEVGDFKYLEEEVAIVLNLIILWIPKK